MTGALQWWQRVLLALLVGWLFVLMVVASRDKAFWHDEIYTVLASAMPPATLWRASIDGVDLSPPLFTALTHLVRPVVGVGHIATRLPSMAAFLVAAVVVFAMVRRRAGALVAFAAVLALASTEAWHFATEARGYSLTVAWFALVLLGWSEAAAGRRAAANLALMSIALAAGVWTHYYFVLALLPVAVGEGVRQLRGRRLEKAPWLAMGIAGVAMLGLLPLAEAAASQRPAFWARPQKPGVAGIYPYLHADFGLPHVVIALLLLLAAVQTLRRLRSRTWPLRVPLHEIAAGAVCLALPALCALLGYFLQVFDQRYATFTSAGLAIVIPVAIWVLTSDRGPGTALFAAAVAAGFVGTSIEAFHPPLWRDPYLTHPMLAQQLQAGREIVVTGGADYLAYWYYAPDDEKGRVLYVADPVGQLRDTGRDTIDSGYVALARWAPVPVRPLDDFLRSHASFLLYSPVPGWTEHTLALRGATLTQVSGESTGSGVLYDVSTTARPAARAPAPRAS